MKKHLTLSDRIIIEQKLNEGTSIRAYDRFFYIATYANDLYQDTLISSREGINQEPEKIREMDELISPLIKKG